MTPPAPPPPEVLPILLLTPHLAVINKPAGLPCHAGPGRAGTVEDQLRPLRRGHDGPWLAHRLDSGTSGCLLIARRKTALIAAQQALAQGACDKTYLAIVNGTPPAQSGVMEDHLRKITSPAGWHMVTGAQGQAARAEYQVLASAAGHALLALRLHSGRTHQLRVQCASRGFPVLGDAIYGGQPAARMMLHAQRLAIPALALDVTAPPTDAFSAACAALGLDGLPQPVAPAAQ